ncbi:hypothetical protein AURDEDRAFT_152061 [Auricularia subglabra TFB-10046 SS5]|nr:hypothetical protein AURDEDRAFT_152061 [Auricularia subglabra TFB-10046 SS5]
MIKSRIEKQHAPLLLALLAVVAWCTWNSGHFPHVNVRSTRLTAHFPAPLGNSQASKREISEASDSSADDPAGSASTDFDWFKASRSLPSYHHLPPSKTLHWVPCYETPFQCARLEVPLDYARPDGEQAAVALLKLPSLYPLGHELYRGPILYNPGGPGGSGVDIVRAIGQTFSAVIGDEFDHIGFDPRGIGRSTPVLDTMPSDAERMTWSLSLPLSINSSEDAVGKFYGYSHILGTLVEQRQKKAAQHMSTAIVARDMLAITKAHGRDKLQYWGFSYGTVLGITFAAMFPQNVGSVIVDGVVDTENYYSSAWDNNLRDADKAFQMVIDACVASSACPLHESSRERLGARINAFFDGLKTAPLTVQNGATYGIVTYPIARTLLFRSLYSPIDQIPPLFTALAAAEKGDGAPLYALTGRTESSWRGPCGAEGKVLPPIDTTAAVACGDGDAVSDESLEELQTRFAKMAETSSFADFWMIHAACTGWKVRPVERYNGPFIGNTSHPMLFIGNVADPVAPLWAAEKMSKGFTDAVVLTQNSPGHCSIAAPSLCTVKTVRAYFRDGTLPAPGTVCDVDQDVFPADGGKKAKALGENDLRLLEAARDLSARFSVPRLGLM